MRFTFYDLCLLFSPIDVMDGNLPMIALLVKFNSKVNIGDILQLKPYIYTFLHVCHTRDSLSVSSPM